MLALAAAAGFEHSTIAAGPFRLLAFSRDLDNASSLVVYIEGDGHAWRTRRAPSSDPSPWQPLALRLALQDRSPSVLYIARPCQYLDTAELKRCDQRYWTSHRYAEVVVAAMSAAIDRALAESGAGSEAVPIGLVGHSGGGTIAALLAARRHDVVWLVTLSGNLDHHAWSEWHRVTPLAESLNLRQAPGQLAAVPQVHFLAGRDRTVPPEVVEPYLRSLGSNAPMVTEIIPHFDHHCCWERIWPDRACAQLEALHGFAFTPCR